MKKLLIAVFAVGFLAIAGHVSAAQCGAANIFDTQAGVWSTLVCNNGPIIPRTSWEVYQTDFNASSTPLGYTSKVVKVVDTEAEYYRLSMLDVARQLIMPATNSTPAQILGNWHGTIIQEWLDRYLAGER